jgi:hypothetical protein
LVRHSDDCPVLFIQKKSARGQSPWLETVGGPEDLSDNDANVCQACGHDALGFITCACHDEPLTFCSYCGDYQFRTAGLQAVHPEMPEVTA